MFVYCEKINCHQTATSYKFWNSKHEIKEQNEDKKTSSSLETNLRNNRMSIIAGQEVQNRSVKNSGDVIIVIFKILCAIPQ